MFIHVVACNRISFLSLNNIPLYVYTTLSLSVHWLITFGLLPSLCSYECFSHKHTCANISVRSCFQLFKKCTQTWNSRLYVSSICNMLMNCLTVFISSCIILQPPNSVLEFQFLHVFTRCICFDMENYVINDQVK